MKEKLGNLAKTGVPTLLHLIYEKGDAACILDIVNEPAKKRFFFKNGMPVAASSNILSEVLGRLLMQERVITQRDYETSLEVVLKEKKKHGSVLISMGLITREDLDAFLTLQLKKRLLKVFGWKDGEYRYLKADSLPPDMTQKPLHPAPLILEGITLGFYPPSRAKEDLRGLLDAAFKVTDAPGKYRVEDFNINLQEKRFLESFDGTKTLKEVLDASDLLRGRANALALSFIITGLVKGPAAVTAEVLEEEVKESRTIEAPGAARLNAELLFMKAKTALREKDYEGALEVLREITELNPVEGEYWAHLGWTTYCEDPSKIKEAEKIIKDAIDLNTELDSAWYFLGKIYLAGGNAEWAEKAFRTALGKNAWAMEALAEIKCIEIKKSRQEDCGERKKYMEAFGFLEDPFASAPDLKYRDISPGRARALEGVVKDIKNRTGPILLEGVEGAGKTAFSLELLKRLADEKVLAAYVLKPDKKEILLIKAINAEFGSLTESSSVKDELLSLGMRVSQNRTQGGHTLIIINNAHLLTPGCVKLVQYLSRLKTLQILLIAGPFFSESLKAPEFQELDKKLLSRYSLNPLTLEETREYLLRRLNETTRKGPLLPLAFSITDDAIKLIFEESGGVPAEINRKSALMLIRAGELNKTALDMETAEFVSGKKEILAEPSSPKEEFKKYLPASFKEAVRGGKTEPTAEAFREESAPLALEGAPPPREIEDKETALREEAVKVPWIKSPEPFTQKPKKEPEVKPEEQAEAFPSSVEKPLKGFKTRVILLVVLLLLVIIAGLLPGSFIRVYLLGEKGGEAPIVNAPPPKERGTKEVTAPLEGTANSTPVPSSDAEKAQDNAASLKGTVK